MVVSICFSLNDQTILGFFDMEIVNYVFFAGFNGNSGNTGPSSNSSVGEHLEAASSGSRTKDTRNLELPKSLSVPLLSVKTEHSGDNSGEDLRFCCCLVLWTTTFA